MITILMLFAALLNPESGHGFRSVSNGPVQPAPVQIHSVNQPTPAPDTKLWHPRP